MHQCLKHPSRIKAFIFDNFDNSNKFPLTIIFHIIFVKMDSMSGCDIRLLFRPKRVHCSTKNAYTSEITFLALVPWVSVSLKAVPDQECIRYQSSL